MIKKLFNKKNEKDKRIKELWDALNHLVSTVQAYGYMDLYEANTEWQPPEWLRDGEYTTEKRLKDIRYHSIMIREAASDAYKVLLNCDEFEDIPPNY